MNCFPCFSSQRSKKETHDSSCDDLIQSKVAENMEASNQVEHGNLPIQTFNFRELASATRNFRQECLLGEGGFGKVYKGTLQATGQVVAVKQLDRHAMQENKEFLVEVEQLSHLHHPNLVNLIGYCADGDQRLLVYEFMPGGSISDHLFDIKPDKKPLDWITRMKIAYGAAQALEYLHDKTNPPVIYRDLKSLNILLDEEFNPKLSDIGLSKLGPSADKMPMQSRVMGTYGYSAPEYSRSGKLTTTADVYSFGVVLLELITGRKAIDTTKPVDEQNLVAWAQPIFREPKKFPDMADPLLKKRFPERGLNQAVAIAAMCLQDESAARPLMSDVVTALSFLSMATEENSIPRTLPASISSKLHCISTKLQMQFMEPGDEGKLMKKEDSSDEDDGTDSESDHDEDDEVQNSGGRSVSSSRSSSVSRDEKSALTRDCSRRSNDGSAYSREESSKGSHACSGEETSAANYIGDSMNHMYSKESKDARFSSSHEGSRKLPYSSGNKSSRKSVGKYAYLSSSSSSDSLEENDSLSHERSSRKLLDESNSASPKSCTESRDGNVPLRRDSSRKSSDAESVSVSHKSSLKSEVGNDYVENNSSKELIDGTVFTGRKSSKKSKDGNISLGQTSSRKSPGKSRRSTKKSPRDGNASSHQNRSNKSPDESVSASQKSSRKSRHENVSPHRKSNKTSNDEIKSSSGFSRANRRRSKKADDSPDSSISSVGSQDGSEALHHATFTKASTVNF